MVFKSKDGVYYKCNIHSFVSIKGGPAFSVNRPFSKSTHTGNEQQTCNNRNRINGILNYFIENKNNTVLGDSIFVPFFYQIYTPSIFPLEHSSSVYNVSDPPQCMALRPSSYKTVLRVPPRNETRFS